MHKHSLKLAVLTLISVLGVSLPGCDDNNSGSGASPASQAGPFSYRVDTPDKYARVDRMGEPATGTALLSRVPTDPARPTTTNQRDAFNRGDPQNDLANFAAPMSASLRKLHVQLDGQLRSLGLTTCSTGSNSGTDISACLAQAVPAILPDVITFDLSQPDGWPNGRRFDDPVVDRLLAVALLNLATPGQSINTFANLPLNPPGNDGHTIASDPSPTTFPYLRPQHTGPGI